MNKPDPVQHMMLWGSSSSAIVLLIYFFARGLLTVPDIDPLVLFILVSGTFTGFTLGGMAGVIIGTVFQHGQEALNSEKIHNRRHIVHIAVFIMVLVISRILIMMTIGFLEHPLLLSILGAIIASFASHHYLMRMEAWLKDEKPKRKNDMLPERLLDHDEDHHASQYNEDDHRNDRHVVHHK